MVRMTEEEASRLDKYYAENLPELDFSKSGIIARKATKNSESDIIEFTNQAGDYTDYQRKLFNDLSVEELSAKAQAYYESADN